MVSKWVTTKKVLLEHIDRDWDAINALFDSLTEEQLTQIKNPDGWSIKDHIAHLMAWEDSIIALLNRKPRHIGLDVPELVFWRGDYDEINDIIFKKHKDKPLAIVRRDAQSTHDELLNMLDMMDDDDLKQPVQKYLDGTTDDNPVINVIYGNTAAHYKEHQGWIEAMLPA